MRDYGLLESALARPRASASGDDAYPGLLAKAAAPSHSLARNHALVDGNKRLALAATIAFLGINGHRLTLSNDEAYDLVIAVATGALDDVAEIATRSANAPDRAADSNSGGPGPRSISARVRYVVLVGGVAAEARGALCAEPSAAHRKTNRTTSLGKQILHRRLR